MEAFFITHRNQRKQAYLYLSYKHLFVYLFVGFNQGFVHIFTRLYCLGGGDSAHTRTPLAKSLCTRDSSIAIFFLLLSDCSEIWQAPQQYCCRHARQITNRCDNSNYSSLDQVVCFCPVVCIFARLCAVSNAPRSWEKREGCDSVSRCIPQ